MGYADKFPTSMKKGGMKKAQKGGRISKKIEGYIKTPPEKRDQYLKKGPWRKSTGPKVDPLAPTNPKIKKMPKSKAIQNLKKGGFPDLTGDGKVTRADVLKGRGVFKKGGSIMKTAGRTTTGVISDYQGYKGPKSKTPMAKLKRSK